MRAMTIKNIPDELYERLKESAQAHQRSLNREVLVCLDRALGQGNSPSIEDMLAQARVLREMTAGYPLSDAELREARRSGRL